MIRILSFENIENWSWSCVMQFLIKGLNGHFTFLRMYRFNERDINDLPKLECFFDLVLTQNVDGIQYFKNKEKVITRMGGIRTMKGNSHRFDGPLSEVAAIIATNNQLFEIGSAVNPNVFLMPNGLDIERFRPSEKRQERPFTVGFAGNITYPGAATYKGYPLIVAACMNLGVELKNAFWGEQQIDHADMPAQFYHRIDCLVLASENEGCSNVVMEALACGVPVICTKVGYHGDRLTEYTNCLFIERNASSVEDRIKFLRDHESMRYRLAENGRRFAKEHHDIRKIALQYKEIFERCINGKH